MVSTAGIISSAPKNTALPTSVMNLSGGQSEPQALPIGNLEAPRGEDEPDDQQCHADAARDPVEFGIVQPGRYQQPGRVAEDRDASEPQRNQP